MVDKMPDQVSMSTAAGRITDPFVVLSKGQPTINPASTNASPSQPSPASAASSSTTSNMKASERENKRTSAKVSSTSNPAASSLSKSQRLSPSDNSASKSRDDFGTHATTESTENNHLLMPLRINLHEPGLRCLLHLQEKTERRHEKAHVTWASKLLWVVTLVTLFFSQ